MKENVPNVCSVRQWQLSCFIPLSNRIAERNEDNKSTSLFTLKMFFLTLERKLVYAFQNACRKNRCTASLSLSIFPFHYITKNSCCVMTVSDNTVQQRVKKATGLHKVLTLFKQSSAHQFYSVGSHNANVKVIYAACTLAVYYCYSNNTAI